jgi:hypothetical protein
MRGRIVCRGKTRRAWNDSAPPEQEDFTMNDSAMRGGRKRAGASRAIVVLGCLILVALVGVIVVLVMLLNRKTETTEPQNNSPRAVIVHEDTVGEQVERIIRQPPVEPGYYQASMTLDWVFPDGSSPSENAVVRNEENNTNDVYFDIMLRDSREVIYESPVIPLGSYIDNITLDKDLDAGTYRCIIVYHLLDENQKTISTLNMGLTITVEN